MSINLWTKVILFFSEYVALEKGELMHMVGQAEAALKYLKGNLDILE
jgi:hypothetical protein